MFAHAGWMGRERRKGRDTVKKGCASREIVEKVEERTARQWGNCGAVSKQSATGNNRFLRFFRNRHHMAETNRHRIADRRGQTKQAEFIWTRDPPGGVTAISESSGFVKLGRPVIHVIQHEGVKS